MTHYDEINLTALAETYGNGNHEDTAAVISSSDNPAHTALSLLRRLAIDAGMGGLNEDDDGYQFMQELNKLRRLVEYRCISVHEDVIAELKAGDVDRALNMLGAG